MRVRSKKTDEKSHYTLLIVTTLPYPYQEWEEWEVKILSRMRRFIILRGGGIRTILKLEYL